MHLTKSYGKYLMIMSTAALITTFACAPSKTSSNAKFSLSPPAYIIKDVNMISMVQHDKLVTKATITIKDKKIYAINGEIPKDAVVIDGTNKWLIPGLIDMHVHNLADISLGPQYPTKGASLFLDTQDFMLLYIANGVTTVFELSGRAEHFAQRNEIKQGKVIGPRIALAMLIDGADGGANTAHTPAEGRQTVRIAKAQGYEFIKIYSRLTVETCKAIIDEAGKQGMKVVGHIPNAFKDRLEEVFTLHFDMVAHAEEYAKQSPLLTNEDAMRFAKLAKENGTWLSPTLVTMKKIAEQSRTLDSLRLDPFLPYVHPLLQSKWQVSNNYNAGTTVERATQFERIVDFNYRLVKIFRDMGVPIVTGTDAGTSGVIWGFSMHHELDLLVKAGLTSAEALQSATRLPATWLGIGDKTGTIETGKYADLILLDANPLENITNTQKIAGIFADGRWISKQQLDTMLSQVKLKNEAGKEKFDWKKRALLE